MDTGCGKDLVAQRHVAQLQRHVYVKDPFTVNTANGGSTTSERILLSVEPLAMTSEPYIMDSTPPVLSVGARVKDGRSFIWLRGKLPCIVRPGGRIIPLGVKGDTPYLRRTGV